MTYRDYFNKATGGRVPYAYQSRLAGGPDTDPEGNFEHAGPCQSQLISIPTGLGKTAAVVLAWLWNRVIQQSAAWPRLLEHYGPFRLAYFEALFRAADIRASKHASQTP